MFERALLLNLLGVIASEIARVPKVPSCAGRCSCCRFRCSREVLRCGAGAGCFGTLPPQWQSKFFVLLLRCNLMFAYAVKRLDVTKPIPMCSRGTFARHVNMHSPATQATRDHGIKTPEGLIIAFIRD